MAASGPPTGARTWLLAYLCCCLWRPARGYSSGAGRLGCGDMTPRHNNAPLQNIHHQYQASGQALLERVTFRAPEGRFPCGSAHCWWSGRTARCRSR
ncbi:unnamed protein product [Ixodes persulcatus]